MNRRRRGSRRGGRHRDDDEGEGEGDEGGETRRRGGRGGGKRRFKPKSLTVEELDAQMDDYFNREVRGVRGVRDGIGSKSQVTVRSVAAPSGVERLCSAGVFDGLAEPFSARME